MRTRLWAGYGAATLSLVAAGGAVIRVGAQQAPPPPPAPARQSHDTYDSGIRGGMVTVDSAPGQVQVHRLDGVPVQVTASPGGGLMLDLGIMKRTLGPDGKWATLPGGAHTIVRMPMDLATMRVTIGSSLGMSIGNGAAFEDQHGHHLSVFTTGWGQGSGGGY